MNDNCKHRAMESIMKIEYLALLAAVGTLAACTEIVVENEPPEAVAVLETPLTEGGYIESGASVVINGSASVDPDGSIALYYWRRTDLTQVERYGLMRTPPATDDNPMPEPIVIPPVEASLNDPGSVGPTLTLSLPDGTYRYSLWVKDNEGAVSVPASVELQVGPAYEPDMACLAAYPEGAAENYPLTPTACKSCLCSPSEGGLAGCYDAYAFCFLNEDPDFAAACGALVECAVQANCESSACVEPCMAEIGAAASYNGGTTADCSDPSSIMTNPCSAATQGLSACSKANCAALCPTPRSS